MMKVPIGYYEPDGKGKKHPFWQNLLDEMFYQHHDFRIAMDQTTVAEMEKRLFAELAKYGAGLDRGQDGIYCVEFDSKENMLLFMMRWA